MDTNSNRLPIVEALILSSPEPLPSRKIVDMFDNMTPSQVDEIVTVLNERYHSSDMSFRIRKIAGGYQMYIMENYAGYVDELYTRRRTTKLSRAALETLAIIAYRQPVTKGDIELIRGVASDSAIHTLLQRKLITLAGRAKSLGRPLLYATTSEFLKYFNLNTLDDLPRMEEIEELLASVEPDNQQSLSLEEVKKVVLKKGPENDEEDEDERTEDELDSETALDDDGDMPEDDTDDMPEIPETLSEEEELLAEIIDEAVDQAVARNLEQFGDEEPGEPEDDLTDDDLVSEGSEMEETEPTRDALPGDEIESEEIKEQTDDEFIDDIPEEESLPDEQLQEEIEPAEQEEEPIKG